MKNLEKFAISVGCLLLTGWGSSEAKDSDIRLNSIGFLPKQAKEITISATCEQFILKRAKDGSSVLNGKTSGPVQNSDTGETVYFAEFSKIEEPGTYYVEIPDVGRSFDFKIGKDIYNFPFYTVMRGMYLWRCGCAVSGTHNGVPFAHEACHLDDAWMDYATGEKVKKEGLKGWHDAGDYNKYVVNAGVTVGMMFQAWEQYKTLLKDIRLDIPESGNSMPDFLDEMKWEIDWLLTMQAEDGKVYHKISTTKFGGFILPEKETTKRFYTPWGTAATADFVAMMAMAARIYKPYDPDYAAHCLAAAKKSYDVLQKYPDNIKPDLSAFSTGTYSTQDPDDRLWAAAELWETCGDPEYLLDFEKRTEAYSGKIDLDWDWSNVKNLGMVTYLLSERKEKTPAVYDKIKQSLLGAADQMIQNAKNHGYRRLLGTKYYWGCNGTVARLSLVLMTANRITPKGEYVNTVLDANGHLFGRNYFGRSFVTGLGANPPMHPHDRRSGGDSVKEPWPGYLVGGGWPNGSSWVDDQESYQTNEIAINWNGALIYALAAFVESKESGIGQDEWFKN